MNPTLPKALLPVAGRPFIAWQLDWLATEGVHDVVLCVGHMSQSIRGFVGNGAAWGLTVEYVDEGRRLRGTGGALRHAVDAGVLGPEVFVLYGDSYLMVKLDAVYSAFCEAGNPAIMTVLKNCDQWQPSNVAIGEGVVLDYTKTGPERGRFEFIDYGLSVWNTATIEETIPSAVASDLGDAFKRLAAARRLSSFEVHERFFEIGSPEGLHECERFLVSRAGVI